MTTSIGIALSGKAGDTPETLLRNADAAMYRAKDNGRNRAELFDAKTHHRAVDDLRTGNELHRAIERGEMRVYYQPMISLDTGEILGLEALIRWEHPERGLGAADGVRAPRRRDRPHRAARRVGTRRSVPTGRAVAGGLTRRTPAGDEREPLATPTRRARAAERGGARVARHRHPPRLVVAGDHGEHADARHRVRGERARRAALAGAAPRGRRLRFRLLVARLPPAAPGGGVESRSARSPKGSASARTAPRSSTPSSAWAGRCTCRRWPRASRTRSSSAGSGPWAATSGRDTCSARPSRPRPTGPSPAGRSHPRRRYGNRSATSGPDPTPPTRPEVADRVRRGDGSSERGTFHGHEGTGRAISPPTAPSRAAVVSR